MSLDVRIKGSTNTRVARVTKRNALVTSLSTDLATEDQVINIPYSNYLTVDGISLEDGGQFDLSTVVGSLADPVDAYVRSSIEGDIFLTTLNIVLGDSAVGLNQFGGIGVLTNGVQLFYETTTSGRTVTPIPFRTSFDFLRSSTLTEGLGSKTDAYKMANVGVSSSDAYCFQLDLTRLSPLSVGIRLRQDSGDRLGVSIRDSMVGLTEFNLVANGFVQLGVV